jgi:hypothetical protein
MSAAVAAGAAAKALAKANIERLYAAFARLDGAAMQACYAADAAFDDEAFSLRGADQIGGMWRMLCDATREKGADVWQLQAGAATDQGDHWALHWEAHYRFSATGRLVHNTIGAQIRCAADGLIVQHRDSFDFWRWSRQALGAPGWLLGWTPMLRAKVRGRAAANLAAYLARTPR